MVGIEGLTLAGFYGEFGSGSHENHKDFTPYPTNAVVVPDDPYKRNNPGSDTLVITNGAVNKLIKVNDGYDARGEVENSLYREANRPDSFSDLLETMPLHFEPTSILVEVEKYRFHKYPGCRLSPA